jgi:3-ketosteroid 9alpha-monooxygenase subunit B
MGDRHDDVLREHGYHSLRVKAIVEETDDTKSFVVDVPVELEDMFQYRPGQFCTFRVHVGEAELMRCYSMSSTPATDADLAVTVKRVVGGAVSNWLNDNVTVGDHLDVTKPAGVFCPRDRDVPVVAFCGGSGVTPVYSILKHVLATTQRSVKLLYANRNPGSVIFDRELQDLHTEYRERFQLRHHFDSEGGYLDKAAVADFVAGPLDADYYICGPTPFMDLVETTLHDAGVDPADIAIERFLAAPTHDEPEPAPGASEDDATETLTLVLRRKSHTVAYQPGDTILETARRNNLQAPYSCEAGNCATCMAFLRDGAATMRVNNALTPAEVEEGWILTCQSIPVGRSVTVEYEAL